MARPATVAPACGLGSTAAPTAAVLVNPTTHLAATAVLRGGPSRALRVVLDTVTAARIASHPVLTLTFGPVPIHGAVRTGTGTGRTRPRMSRFATGTGH